MAASNIGDTLARLRKDRGMTQKELAEKLNVSDKTVSKWEKGQSYPDVTIFPLLSSIFGGSRVNYDSNVLQHRRNDSIDNAKASSSHPVTSKFSEVIDLSSCLHDSQLTIPTLNG